MPTVGLKFRPYQGPSSYWFGYAEIKLINNPTAEIMSPPDTLHGILLLHVDINSCFLQNIRVQLEGHAISRVPVDDSKDEIFTPDDLGAVIFEYKVKKYTRGTHTFPFKIPLSGQEFPATFESIHGEIYYKLVAYINHINPKELLTCDQLLTTKGHLNLNLHPKLGEPQSVTKQKEKPWFSTRPVFKVHFRLDKKGFLPEENLNFAVIVENPTCEKIVRMQMVFVQKITYYARLVTKTMRNVFHEKKNEVDSFDADIRWEAGFEIPANLIPSFKKGRKYHDINYTIEFTVWIIDAPPLKGELAIVIGTTNSTASNSNSPLNLVAGGSRRPNRSQSFSDLNWDAVSLQSCSTLPPSYSNLSSRRPSLSSIETLPPNYASVMRVMDEKDESDEEWEDVNNFRPRCTSNPNAK